MNLKVTEMLVKMAPFRSPHNDFLYDLHELCFSGYKLKNILICRWIII